MPKAPKRVVRSPKKRGKVSKAAAKKAVKTSFLRRSNVNRKSKTKTKTPRKVKKT